MPAGFDTLGDQDMRSRLGGFLGLLNRADLAQHQTPGLTQPADDVRAKIPKQGHRGDTLGNDGIELGLEKFGARGGRNEIDAETPRRRSTHPRDFRAYELGRFPHHA